jgi:hypothetical protein
MCTWGGARNGAGRARGASLQALTLALPLSTPVLFACRLSRLVIL